MIFSQAVNSIIPYFFPSMDPVENQQKAITLKQYEEACSDFQIPATRAAAEQVLCQFRTLPKALYTCQYILDHTQSPMVQFQVTLAIAEVVIRDYTIYDLKDIIQLKNYMIDFCLQRPTLMKYVRDQLVLAVALITKRSLFDVTDNDRGSILLHIKQLLGMEEEKAQILGLSLGNALIDQFSNAKSNTIGLAWEHHYKCKLFFESHILLPLFEQSITKLHSVVSLYQQAPQDTPPLLVELMISLEKILNWEFESTNTTPTLPGTFVNGNDMGEFDREDGPSSVRRTYVTFPQEWQPTAGNSDVLWLFFMTYFLIQEDDVSGHRCRQCLIQLSGFQKEFFMDNTNVIKSYATTMIHGIRKMMNEITKFGTSPDALSEQGPQMLGTIQMIRRLLENTSLAILCSIPDFFPFLNEVGIITVSCLKGTVVDVDEGWISEACDECLQTWVNIANTIQPGNMRAVNTESRLTSDQVGHLRQYMTNVSYQVTEAFIETRLQRANIELENEEEEDEIDTGFKDWDTFGDQLTCIGELARFNPQPCLHTLQLLLNERLENFKSYFTTNRDNDPRLILLHEQIHWLILIIGHIIADSGKGELPMIPDSIMQLSGSQSYGQDQAINLCNTILELFRFSSSFNSNSIEASYCSPRVAETLVWFMERWSKSYLLIDENEYGYISPNIARAFGQPGPSDGQGEHIIDFFIQQMRLNFILWNADPDVLTQLVKWLNTFGTSRTLRKGLLNSVHFPELVQFVTQNLEQLPEIIHNSLIQTITIISSGSPDEITRNNYYGLMFKMIEDRLGSLLHRPDFQKCYQQAEVINNIINAIEMFDGLALACQYNNTQTIFSFCSRFFESFVQLLNLYKTVPEVQLSILQLFSDLSDRLDFGLINANEKRLFFNTIIEILKIFGVTNQGKKRMHSQEEEEDRPYAEIATVLTMLTNVMASGMEDFSRKESNADHSDIAEVVLFGINIVIPMIDLQMLKIPSLCQQYIRLISRLIETFPDKLPALPQSLYDNLMNSLEYGIQHVISDVNILALHAITPLTLWAYEQQRSGGDIRFLVPALEKFLKCLVELLLFSEINMNIIDAASDALLALICIQKGLYMALVNEIIMKQTEAVQSRLIRAFGTLDQATPQQALPVSGNAPGFKESFLTFLMDVRAVLRIK
ncbi:armadillo-type protein [Pilobolus umbonatus]|nr:armadillo-type protein [Pilobolus umbonatus]